MMMNIIIRSNACREQEVRALRITTQQEEENRARIVAVASKLFRESGFDGTGVAELMKNAGMRHGGFYNHFGSKEELESAACDLAFERPIARISAAAKETQEARRSAYVGHVADYLSPRDRDAAGGCPMVYRGGEVFKRGDARAEVLWQRRFSIYRSNFCLDRTARTFAGADDEDAIVTFAMLVGGRCWREPSTPSSVHRPNYSRFRSFWV
jgi:AcrR family transcriptional regulator